MKIIDSTAIQKVALIHRKIPMTITTGLKVTERDG